MNDRWLALVADGCSYQRKEIGLLVKVFSEELVDAILSMYEQVCYCVLLP